MKSLRQLIEDEYFAMIELEGRESTVKYCANQLSSCDRDSDFYKFYKEDYNRAIANRYDAMEKLNSVRKELKEYLVNIMENY